MPITRVNPIHVRTQAAGPLEPRPICLLPRQTMKDGENNIDNKRNMQPFPGHIFLIIVTIICCLLQRSLGFTYTAHQRAANGLIHQLVVVL
jgi:hypothetical protein